jgi:6-phosphogluconate dehydrogenase
LINNVEDTYTIKIAVKDTNAIEALINQMRNQKQLSGGEDLDAVEALVNTAENPKEVDTAVEDPHTVETLINTNEETNVY